MNLWSNRMAAVAIEKYRRRQSREPLTMNPMIFETEVVEKRIDDSSLSDSELSRRWWVVTAVCIRLVPIGNAQASENTVARVRVGTALREHQF